VHHGLTILSQGLYEHLRIALWPGAVPVTIKYCSSKPVHCHYAVGHSLRIQLGPSWLQSTAAFDLQQFWFVPPANCMLAD
jgi:hypothetical protein